MQSTSKKIISIAIMLSLTMGVFFAVASSPGAQAADASVKWQSQIALNRATYLNAYTQIGDVLYVFGGRVNVSTVDLKNAYTYNLLTGAQANLPDLPLGVSGASALVGDDGLIYIIGGRNISNPTYSMTYLQIFNPTSKTYTRGADMLIGMTLFDAVKLPSGKFVVMGGNNLSASHDEVQIYDPATNVWTMGSSIPTISYSAVTVLMNDVIWYIGGSDTSGEYDTVYNYNYMTDSWTLTPVKLQTGLAAAKGLAAMDGLVYVTGGGTYPTSTGGINASCYMNLLGNNFVSIPNMGTARKYHMMAESSDGRIFVLGGFKPLGFNYAATTSVESLKIATTSLTLSASSIGTGEKLTASLNLVYTYSNFERLSGNIKLVDASNNVYDLGTFSGSMAPKISREVSIPQNITPGTYRFVLYDIEGYTGSLLMSDAFPVFQTNVQVTALPSVEESVAVLEQQNANLTAELQNLTAEITATKARLAVLEQQNVVMNGELTNITAEINATKAILAVLEHQNDEMNTELQDIQAHIAEMQSKLDQKIDQKLDSTIGYLIMVLVIVTLVVVILQFLMFMRKKT